MKKLFVILIIFVGILLAAFVYVAQEQKTLILVNNFAECAEHGYPVMESYPRQCKTPDGKTFVEVVDTEPVTPLAPDDMIRVFFPQPNALVSSPLVIAGEARGPWYFEASFPAHLFDGNGTEIAVMPISAQGEWMTEDFVPFNETFTFPLPTTATGTLVLKKDNPSGLPELDAQISIPVTFTTVASSTASTGACVVTGCSSHICAEEEIASTCEFLPEYSCYASATCERQTSGECGWTQTATLSLCIQNARN